MSEFKHYTVLAKEATDMLQCKNGKIYIDCTLGGGGHSEIILKKIQPDGKLIAFDVDDDAIEFASERLKEYKNLTIIKESYINLEKVLSELKIEKITGGIIVDLGASFYQLTSAERGFSFSKNAPLDMRFDKEGELTAYDVVNTYKEDDLVKIFSEYGEERFSKRIAKTIVETRKNTKIKTTFELSELIIKATPKIKQKIHPATRVFQAIRIEVNKELNNVKILLKKAIPLLEVGAIISVISFHSLEDRLVKIAFKELSSKCNCPPNKAICDCPKPVLKLITKKPIVASDEEIRQNPPSRSAKLRVAIKI